MNKADILEMIDELLAVESGTTQGSEELSGLDGWDSLAVVTFIALVDERFGFVLSPAGIAACETVDDLIELVGSQL